MARFEADLSPEGQPRLRFNFANNWSASVVLRTPTGKNTGCNFLQAYLACCPSDHWGEGVTELGQTEATPEEVVAFLAEVSGRTEP